MRPLVQSAANIGENAGEVALSPTTLAEHRSAADLLRLFDLSGPGSGLSKNKSIDFQVLMNETCTNQRNWL